MGRKKTTQLGTYGLLLAAVLVVSCGVTANAQDNDSTSNAIDNAPLSGQVLNKQHESASVGLSNKEGTVAAKNNVAQDASISYNLNSGASVKITSQDDKASAGADTTAQVLADKSARLLTVFTDPQASLVSKYSTEIPDGWAAEKRPDGGYNVVPGKVLRKGLTDNGIGGDFILASIDAPLAKDANGRSVKTSFELVGNQLRQTVTPDAKTVFPIVADPRVVGHGYYFSIYYNKSETRGMRDTGTVVGFILAAGGAIAALPGGIAIAAALYLIGAGAVGMITTIASYATSEGRCLKLDVPSFYPSSVKC